MLNEPSCYEGYTSGPLFSLLPNYFPADPILDRIKLLNKPFGNDNDSSSSPIPSMQMISFEKHAANVRTVGLCRTPLYGAKTRDQQQLI